MNPELRLPVSQLFSPGIKICTSCPAAANSLANICTAEETPPIAAMSKGVTIKMLICNLTYAASGARPAQMEP